MAKQISSLYNTAPLLLWVLWVEDETCLISSWTMTSPFALHRPEEDFCGIQRKEDAMDTAGRQSCMQKQHAYSSMQSPVDFFQVTSMLEFICMEPKVPFWNENKRQVYSDELEDQVQSQLLDMLQIMCDNNWYTSTLNTPGEGHIWSSPAHPLPLKCPKSRNVTVRPF